MEVRPSEKETDAKEVAPLKALLPMDVRPSGKETDAKEVASLKAERPMDVRPSGSAIEIKETQVSKARPSMEVTPAGTTTWPFASAVYRQRGEQDQGVQIACTGSVAAPSASRTKIVDILSAAKPTRNLTPDGTLQQRGILHVQRRAKSRGR